MEWDYNIIWYNFDLVPYSLQVTTVAAGTQGISVIHYRPL